MAAVILRKYVKEQWSPVGEKFIGGLPTNPEVSFEHLVTEFHIGFGKGFM